MNDIEIYNMRDLTYNQAKKEIDEYIENANGRVFISEIAEKLKIDIELIRCILDRGK